MLSILFFTIVGIVVTFKKLFGRGTSPLAPQRSRLEKLELVEEMLGDRMPDDLRLELAGWRGQPPPAPKPEPAAPASADTAATMELPVVAAVLAAAPGDAVDSVVDLASDDRPLTVAPEVEAIAAAASPVLRSFLSFENVIFMLSAVLILGGTLYFAAITWNHVPGSWQYFFVETMTAFYGAMMLVGAWLLVRRLNLASAGRILTAIACGVSAVCAVIAAAAFEQSAIAGLAGVVLASGFAYWASATLAQQLRQPATAAWSFAAAIGLVALAGGVSELGAGLSIGVGACLLAASGLIAAVYFANAPVLSTTLLVVALAIPTASFLLLAARPIALSTVAPILAVLAWSGQQLRRAQRPWAVAATLALAAAGAVFALPTIGAVAAAALVGAVACWRCSQPLDASSSDGPARARALLAPAAAAGVLWVVLAMIWAPAIGSTFPPWLKQWFVDLVTRPGERVAASWDGLAALPSMALALWFADHLRRRDDRRALLIELAAWATLVLSLVASLATLERQPWPTTVVLGLCCTLWYFWAWRRASLVRWIGAHLTLLVTAFAAGYAFDPHLALVTTAIVALALFAVAGRSGRVVGVFALPIAVIAALADDQAWGAGLALLLAAYGVLALWQPRKPALGWVRPFGPPALLLAQQIALFYESSGVDALVDNRFFLLALAAPLVVGTAVLAWRRRPRFLYVELHLIAGALAFFGTTVAAGFERGSPDATSNASAAVVAMLCLLAAARAASGVAVPIAWAVVMAALPWPTICLTEALLGWPGAAVAALGLVALVLVARRQRLDWLTGVGLTEGLVAAVWATLVVARIFSTGGGEERVLTALAVVSMLYGGAIAGFGLRLTAASDRLLRGSALACLGLALLLGGIGIGAVEHPNDVDIALACATLVGVGLFSLQLALRDHVGWPIYLTEAALVALYGYLRARTGWLDFLDEYDAVVLAALSFAYLGLSRWLAAVRSGLGVDQCRRLAMLLPLAIPVVMQWHGEVSDSFALAAGSALYAVLARQQRQMRYGWLAAVLLNLMLVPIWLRLDVDSPIILLTPIGLTLLALTRIYGDKLAAWQPLLRTVAALIVLGASSVESFQFESVWPAAWLAACAIGAVLLGIGWRLRSYLYTGFVFVVLDLVVNLTRWGMRDRFIAGTLGVGVGIALFVLGVLVARRKEQLLARYRQVQAWQW